MPIFYTGSVHRANRTSVIFRTINYWFRMLRGIYPSDPYLILT